MSFRRSVRVILSVLAMVSAMGVSAAGAQEARAVGVTPPRLSFLDGEVSYWRPGAEDWVPGQINTALGVGDSVFTGDGGNVEIEIGSRAYVRAGSGTQVGIDSLETGYLQLRLPAGHATVDLRRTPDGQLIEVDTPNGAFLISQAGYYRFDVEEDATRFSARRGGIARVVPAGGEEIEIGSTQQIVVTGTETAQLQRIAAASDDAWDRWNYDRTAGLSEQPRSVQYVSPDVAGVDDLDRYGDWRETPRYGNVWVPRGVGREWSPYSDGRWVWDGYYGWTWVDEAPWGWAPYHYGRWAYVDDYWAWAPGPIVARPVYSPALVAFFGGGGVSVSVSVGTPFVSWVPLGWGEPVVPWWGPRGFVGRPYWGGWGGPRYVNNIEINNTTIINVNNINRYDNIRHRNAVIGIDGDRFGRGRHNFTRVDSDRVRNLRPVRGELGVRPVRASLTPREGRGERPPDRIQNRRVVATRAPQDPARQPRSSGLVRSDTQRRPEPRIVTPRSDRTGGGVDRVRGRDVPPARGMERGSVERSRGASDRPSSEVQRGNAGQRNEDGRIERIPGGERGQASRGEGTRGQPQPPSSTTRVPRERDRNGRDIGTSVERRGVDREPTPPSAERGRQAERTRGDAPVPPRVERGNDRIQQPERKQQNQAPDRAPRVQQPARAPRNEAPRAATPPRSSDSGAGGRGAERQRIEQPRVEQPRREQPREQPQPQPQQRMQAPSRNERSSSRDPGRSSVQRESAPRQQRQAQPRVESAPRPQRQAQPRTESAPRQQRQEQPRVERGGGGGSGGSRSARNEGGGGRGRDRERN